MPRTIPFLLALAALVAYALTPDPAFAQAATACQGLSDKMSFEALETCAKEDAAYRWLTEMFGPLFSFGGDGGAEAEGTSRLIGEYARLMNTAIAAVGGIVFTYLATVGIMHTANDGEVLGKQWSSLWVPARVITGAAFMVPLANGFNGVQLLMAKAAMVGVGLAHVVWIQAVDFAFKAPITTGQPAAVEKVVLSALDSLVCTEVLNGKLGVGGAPKVAINYDVLRRTVSEGERAVDTVNEGGGSQFLSGVNYYVGMGGAKQDVTFWSFNGVPESGLAPGICGKLAIPAVRDDVSNAAAYEEAHDAGGFAQGNAYKRMQRSRIGHEIASPIRKAHAEAITWLMGEGGNGASDTSGLRRLAQDIYTFTAGVDSGSNGIPSDEEKAERAKEFAGRFNAIVQNYNSYMNGMVQSAIANMRDESKYSSKLKEEMQAGGWTMAGTWYLRLGNLNAEVAAATQLVPETARPNYSRIDLVNGGYDPSIKKHYLLPASQMVGRVWEEATKGLDPSYRRPRLTYADAESAAGSSDVSSGALGNQISMASGLAEEVMGMVQDFSGALVDAIITPGLTDSDWTDGQSYNEVSPEAWTDPLAYIVSYGHTLINVAWIGGLTAFAGSFIASISVAVPDSLSMLLAILGGILFTGIGAAGAFLAVVIPTMPFILWTTGIVGWLVLVGEAIIAGPLWAFAHLRAEGHGLSGEQGKQGWYILFNVIFRPVLMIGGFILGLTIFTIAARYILMAWQSAKADAVGANGAGLIVSVIFVVILGGILTTAAERSFKLINWIPDNIVRWFGGHQERLGEQEDNQRNMQIGGAAISNVQQAGSQTSRAAMFKGSQTPDAEGQARQKEYQQAMISMANSMGSNDPASARQSGGGTKGLAAGGGTPGGAGGGAGQGQAGALQQVAQQSGGGSGGGGAGGGQASPTGAGAPSGGSGSPTQVAAASGGGASGGASAESTAGNRYTAGSGGQEDASGGADMAPTAYQSGGQDQVGGKADA